MLPRERLSGDRLVGRSDEEVRRAVGIHIRERRECAAEASSCFEGVRSREQKLDRDLRRHRPGRPGEQRQPPGEQEERTHRRDRPVG